MAASNRCLRRGRCGYGVSGLLQLALCTSRMFPASFAWPIDSGILPGSNDPNFRQTLNSGPPPELAPRSYPISLPPTRNRRSAGFGGGGGGAGAGGSTFGGGVGELKSTQTENIPTGTRRLYHRVAPSPSITTTSASKENSIVVAAAVLSVILVLLLIITIFIYIRYYRPDPSSIPADPEKANKPFHPLPLPPLSATGLQRPPEIRIRRLKRFQTGNKVILTPKSIGGSGGAPYPTVPKSPSPSHAASLNRKTAVVRDDIITIEPVAYRARDHGLQSAQVIPAPERAASAASSSSAAAASGSRAGGAGAGGAQPRKPSSAGPKNPRFASPSIQKFPGLGHSNPAPPAPPQPPRKEPSSAAAIAGFEFGFERDANGDGISPLYPKRMNTGRRPEPGSPYVVREGRGETLVQHRKAPSWL